MAIELVRKPSETPNINNHDDYRMFRYATGGYNGVNEKYGNKCSYEIDGSNFKIKSGEIIIDGVQARIDASGETITVDTITGTQYYSVYCEINLSLVDNQKVQIKSTYDTVDYPTIDKGDDLTENQTGIARLELYRFTVSSGAISNVSAQFKIVRYSNGLYDIIIRTQSEFEALIADSTWFEATSVAFIGNGGTLEFTLNTPNNSGIKIPQNVKQIEGFNCAKIKITNLLPNESSAKGGVWYNTANIDNYYGGATSADYLIKNINLDLTSIAVGYADPVVIGGFVNCINLINCSVKHVSSGKTSVCGFYKCSNIINCTAEARGSSAIACGFRECINISNCYCVKNGCYAAVNGYGFYDCKKINNCFGHGYSSNAQGIGFYGCSFMTNCIATGRSLNGNGYGFSTCSFGSCNMSYGSKTAKTIGTMTKWSSETND